MKIQMMTTVAYPFLVAWLKFAWSIRIKMIKFNWIKPSFVLERIPLTAVCRMEKSDYI
ncbi:hypothetical protein Patl1_01260 [Pistacia atlantica]|uniref:Uncharacterized protein n=1 Tax=Pistacia atlantica TaxID=434234 RepID=A0ACC1C402_9ROSI|nr:hypothetical protein Patl1_01260 [Pistacia atlantica]